MRSELDKEEDLNILKWLTPIEYATQQSNYISRRQPGTGQWLLDSAEYQEWLRTPGKTLFCPGIPGAGKTILTAIVVDDVYSRFQGDTSIGIAYLYCDFKLQNQQSPKTLLATLLKQLAQKQNSIPELVQTLYRKSRSKRVRPTLGDISTMLRYVSTLYSDIFIIVDALDECHKTSLGTLLDEIFYLQQRTRARIFSTSRYNLEVVERFRGSVSLEIRASDEDVQKYLAGRMQRLPSFVLGSPDLQGQVKATISEAVDGM